MSLLHTVHVPLGSSRRTCTRHQGRLGPPPLLSKLHHPPDLGRLRGFLGPWLLGRKQEEACYELREGREGKTVCEGMARLEREHRCVQSWGGAGEGEPRVPQFKVGGKRGEGKGAGRKWGRQYSRGVKYIAPPTSGGRAGSGFAPEL